MSELELQRRKQAAHKRAEQIRGNLQEAAVAYSVAITEEDWKVLGYKNIKVWNVAEFGPDRFSTERRKEIHALLTAKGLTQRQIAKATGTSQSQVKRDQAENKPPAGESKDSPAPAPAAGGPPGNQRQQAARQREQHKTEQRKEPERAKAAPRTDGGGMPLHKDERVLTWVTERAKAGRTRDQILAESKQGSDGWPADSHLTVHAYGQIQAVLDDRKGRPAPAPTRSKPKNWNDKSATARTRELKASRARTEDENYLELLKVQEIIVRLASVLQGVNVADWPVNETSLWYVSDLLDDLIGLGTWTDRATSAVQGWLGDADVRAKIAQLRNVNGRTPEEAAIFQKRADKLERQLGLRVSGKAS